MYKRSMNSKTLLPKVELPEGETIEMKVTRLIQNKEPIKDGAPIIYTERKDGVQPGYNVRTDRWEVATEAMDKVTKTKLAQRAEFLKQKDEAKVINIDGGAESTQGKAQ